MKIRLKINGLISVSAFILVVLFPAAFFRQNELSLLDEFSEILGFSFILLGFLWRFSARGYKAEYSKQGVSLIKTGPYSIQRNPMYFGIVLVGIGYILILFNIWAFILFMVFFFCRYIVLIFQEEKKLVLNFGQEYKDYMASTPRLIPSIKVFASKDMREILPLKLSWVKKEIGSFLGVVIAVLLIESWEDVHSGNPAAYVKELAAFVLFLVLFFVLIKYLDIDRQTRVIR